jgi:hypothetical protein
MKVNGAGDCVRLVIRQVTRSGVIDFSPQLFMTLFLIRFWFCLFWSCALNRYSHCNSFSPVLRFFSLHTYQFGINGKDWMINVGPQAERQRYFAFIQSYPEFRQQLNRSRITNTS